MDSRQIKDRGQATETNYNPEKQTTQNTAKQNYPGSVAYHTRPGNKVGLLYSTRADTVLCIPAMVLGAHFSMALKSN